LQDTDSVIYTWKAGEYDIPKGQFLGEWTDELEPGAHITEFVSLGPKTYAYLTTDDKPVVKAKGFTLSHRVGAEINFATYKKLVHKFVQEGLVDTVTVANPQIRKTHDRQVVTVNATKTCRVTYSKRVILSDFTTLPRGHFYIK
jgi:hypothetical protein